MSSIVLATHTPRSMARHRTQTTRAGADRGGDGRRSGIGEGLGERGGEDAQVGGGAGRDAARPAGRVVDGREEQVEGAGGGDALVGPEHGTRWRRAVPGGGDGAPRVGVTERGVGPGGDADAAGEQRAAPPQVGHVVGVDVGAGTGRRARRRRRVG